ncbi:hypothetical protein [Brucella intermedia]|nr:hypothetical protein [Brucella intermedia]
MKTFDLATTVILMVMALVNLFLGRVDMATFDMAFAAANFARMAAFK